MKNVFSKYRILGWWLFPSLLSRCHSSVSGYHSFIEKSAVSLNFALLTISPQPHALRFSVSFVFNHLYMRYLGVVFFIDVLLGSCITSLIHTLMLFTSFREFWAVIYPNIDLVLFSVFFSCSTQIPYMVNLFTGLHIYLFHVLFCTCHLFFYLLCFILSISTHAFFQLSSPVSHLLFNLRTEF